MRYSLVSRKKAAAKTFAALSALVFLSFGHASPLAAENVPDRALPRHEGAELTLERALKIALERNQRIREAEQRIRRQRSVMVEARSFLLPKLNLTGRVDLIDKDLLSSFDGEAFGSNKHWDSAARLTQALYSGGRGSARYEQQRLTAEAAEHELRAVVDEVFLQVRERFYAVLVSRAQLAVQEESVQLLERELATERSRYEAGTVPQFNVLRAEVELANSRTPLIRARNQVKLAYEELVRILGVPERSDEVPATPEQIIGQLQFKPVAYDLEELLNAAALQRSELRRLRLLVDAAEQGVDVEWGRYLPELSLNASYGVEKSQFSDSFSDTLNGWRVGAEANWAIFDSFETSARVDQAKSDLEIARINLRQAALDIDVEVRRAYSSVQEAEALVRASEKVVERAEESLRLARDRLEAGVGTQLEMFDAEVALTEARTNEVQAVHDFEVAWARLQRAVGEVAVREGTAAP